MLYFVQKREHSESAVKELILWCHPRGDNTLSSVIRPQVNDVNDVNDGKHKPRWNQDRISVNDRNLQCGFNPTHLVLINRKYLYE